jgi:hypothetical protein
LRKIICLNFFYQQSPKPLDFSRLTAFNILIFVFFFLFNSRLNFKSLHFLF